MVAIVVRSAPRTHTLWWLPIILALIVLIAGATALMASGRTTTPDLRERIVSNLRRLTGLPAWCAAAIAVALWALVVAVVGFVWDVSWHADLGRDKALFTPAHTMILVGLAGIGIAALAAIVVATWEQAAVGFGLGRIRVPWSAVPLGLMSAGAVIGFPLDDYWHKTYGIDVTMWSPTHLLMIGGASLAPLALWLMLAEAEVPAPTPPFVRMLSEVLASATLLGLSTFQLEFDIGIPQWQALYHPVLIVLAMGIGLLAAREALGPGGAVRAALGFLLLRGVLAVLVGPVFGLSTPHFPLYLGGAAVVEGVFALNALRDRPLGRVVAGGLLLSTAAMAVEWGWNHLWGLQPWQPRLLGGWWVVIAMGLVASIIGSALGRAVAHGPRLLEYRAVAAALAVLALLLAVPYPRHGTNVTATIRATPVGSTQLITTRDGRVAVQQAIHVTVAVSPATALTHTDVFRVFCWQGGTLFIRPLHATGGGNYEIDGTIPTGGTWKSIVFLEKGAVVAAVPVDFPADPVYKLAAIPAPVTQPRVAPFLPAKVFLTRESHGGNALPAILAYSGLAIVAITWLIGLVGVGEAMTRRNRFIAGTVRPAPSH